MAAKHFQLLHYFEPLSEEASYTERRMFGALAIYYEGLMVALISESPGDKSYRGKKYKFEIWDGVLIPTVREYHGLLQSQFPEWQVHPVLGKWLYLPQQSESFEEDLTELVRLIRRKDYRIGIVPSLKKKKKKKKKKARKRLV